MMSNVLTVPKEIGHLLEPVEHRPGFVRIPHKVLYSAYFDPDIFESPKMDDFTEGQYISPLKCKDCVLNELKDDEDTTGLIQTETTVETSEYHDDMSEYIDAPMHISTDHVFAVRLCFWPHDAAAWSNRPCLWPPQDTVQSIVTAGCQLVPRSSPGGDVHSEWRLSFSLPEATLAQLRSRKQQEAYYFFKMLFYRYLKCVESSEPEGKSLFSYVVKTIMLWACEDFSPDDPIWASLENIVQMLMSMLLSCLEAGFVSHYFIPEINLLERVGEDVRSKCIRIITTLQKNILLAAPFDMPEKLHYLKRLHQQLPELEDE